MNSQYGSTDLPRYWITLDKEVIFDYPKQFDTPKDELLTKVFGNDHWGLIDIFRGADRRIGRKRLEMLAKKTHNISAHKVIKARLDLVGGKRGALLNRKGQSIHATYDVGGVK